MLQLGLRCYPGPGWQHRPCRPLRQHGPMRWHSPWIPTQTQVSDQVLVIHKSFRDYLSQGHHADCGCCGATDTNMLLGNSPAQKPLRIWWQTGHQHQPIPHPPCFFRTASYHNSGTIPPLFLSHFSTIYLPIIMAPTQTAPKGAGQAYGCSR